MAKTSSGFVQIGKHEPKRLHVVTDFPTNEDIDNGQLLSGRRGWWFGKFWLEQVGLKREDISVDSVLKCYPRKGDFPRSKAKAAACDRCSLNRHHGNAVAELGLGAEAAATLLGDAALGSNFGSIVRRPGGGVAGATYGLSAVLARPDLLPLVVGHTNNLLEAANHPELLERPGIVRDLRGVERNPAEAVVDFEWNYNKKTGEAGALTVVGVATSGERGFSSHDVSEGIRLVAGWADQGVPIIGHNFIQADLRILERELGRNPLRDFSPRSIIDTLILMHLVHAHWAGMGLYGLSDMVKYYMPTSEWKLDKADDLTYNGRDVAYNFRAKEVLWRDVILTGQEHLVEKQQRLARMTSLMKQKGVRIDTEAIRDFNKTWGEQRKALADALPFNPNSPKQVKAYFASEGIKLETTDYDTLKRVKRKNEVLQRLIAYKDEGKGLKAWFDEEAQEAGRAYPEYKVTGTAVDRFACADPNFQNLPPEYRQFILPDNDDEFIYSIDGKNIEGRTVAWEADDKLMLEDLKTADIHSTVASRIFGRTITKKSPEERQVGKTVVHASNYREGATNLAKRLFGNQSHESIRKAKAFQDAYFHTYKRTREWQEEVERQWINGDVKYVNAFGRVRFVYATDSHDAAKMGCHFLGCSTAAGIVNQKALDIEQELGIRPFGIVHDSLDYSLPKGEAGQRLKRRIKEIAESPIPEMDGYHIPFGEKEGPNYRDLTEE